jgi:hypothetical protein
MSRQFEPWAELWLPAPVVSLVLTISRRLGAPAHRVLDVLLDRYIQRLPAASREKFEERLRRRRERDIQ